MFTTLLFPGKASDLVSYIKPLVSTLGFENPNIDTKLLSKQGGTSKTITPRNNLPKIPKQNWNKVFMIPGPNFSFDKLNISLPYQQLITSARNGDTKAKIQVGMMYMNGVGIQ